MISLFSREMRVVRQTRAQAAEWLADAVHRHASVAAKQSPSIRLGVDAAATSTRAVITTSVFIVLLSATLLVGGHAAIDPFLHPSLDMADARGSSDVVVTMPDGKFCRHMSFDNTTASMVEGMIAPCTTDITRDKRPAVSKQRGFAWSMR